MEIEDVLTPFESFNLWLVIIGIAILATSVLPRILTAYPFSMPIALLVVGYGVVALPFDLLAPDPLDHGALIEHLTELGVIIALMGAGLKIDRPFSFKGWNVTWRLIGVTMILSIALSALVGYWIAAFVPATAMLLGAVIAPTDPVLATEVQVGSPGEGEEDEVRFSLTSEAGLNDGLAFPFTNMAVAMAFAGANPSGWFETWLWIDVFYKLGVGVVSGLLLGYLLARIVLSIPAKTKMAKSMMGMGALASTLIIYGITEYLGGYGFLATFIGAVAIRSYERDHEYHENLHFFIEKSERLLTAGILLALGASIAGGLLAPLTWPLVVSAIIIVFLVRPLAGIIGLIGFKDAPWRERLAISFFGIRGIGSLYYLSYALNEEGFTGTREIWALVSLVIVISIFVHGILAAPITSKLDKLREKKAETNAQF